MLASSVKAFPGLPELKKRGLILDFEAVGSRVTCNPAPTDTDEDWLVLVDNSRPFIKSLADGNGFEWDDSYEELFGEDLRRFQSVKFGTLNLIVTEDPDFYSRFLAASSVAKRLNLLRKSDRVALFHAVLFGDRCDQS